MYENNNSKNSKIQESGDGKSRWFVRDEQGKYNTKLEHIRGNAAIGEQVHSVRDFQTDKPMSFEEMRVHWDEMNREAKEWLDNNPGQSANFITSRGVNGNEITQVVPEKDLIFSGSNLVAIFDKDGNQITGKENIIREIQRRRAERDKWIREGKVENIFDEVHRTDDGWTSNVKFTAYPGQLHPNEVNAESERLIRIATEKRKAQLGVESTQELSERVDDSSSKKPRTEENPKERGNVSAVAMDLDQPETSTSENPDKNLNDKLLTDEKLKELDEKQITSLINQLKAELDKRKNEKGSSGYQKLENQLNKVEVFMRNFESSKPSGSDNKFPTGLVVGSVAGVSVLVAGGVAFMKNKFSKKK